MLSQLPGDADRLPGAIAAVSVDVQRGARPDDLAGPGHPFQVTVLALATALADLDLHPGDMALCPQPSSWSRVC
jgi:hypothetical protein